MDESPSEKYQECLNKTKKISNISDDLFRAVSDILGPVGVFNFTSSGIGFLITGGVLSMSNIYEKYSEYGLTREMTYQELKKGHKFYFSYMIGGGLSASICTDGSLDTNDSEKSTQEFISDYERDNPVSKLSDNIGSEIENKLEPPNRRTGPRRRNSNGVRRQEHPSTRLFGK